MNKRQIKSEVAKNFRIDGKDYIKGDYINFKPYSVQHRRFKRAGIIRDLDLNKVILECNRTSLSVGGKIYSQGDEIPSNVEGAEILIRRCLVNVISLEEVLKTEEVETLETVSETEAVETVLDIDYSINSLEKIAKFKEIELKELKNIIKPLFDKVPQQKKKLSNEEITKIYNTLK